MKQLDMFQDKIPPWLKPSCGRQFAFIDESGNFGFKFRKQGVSSHFIITAVIVDENNLISLEEQVEDIRKKYFQTGEMKSSGVSRNDLRRLTILNELKDLDFHIFSLIVDKRRIWEDSGLAFKPSFIKFLQNLIHDELFRTFPDLQIVSDEHGRKEFMESFKKYVQKKHQPNLFEYYDFGFANSKSEVLIQLADFICGTIATGFEETRKSEKFNDFKNLIRHKILGLKEWPEEYKNYTLKINDVSQTSFDKTIAIYCLRLARDFIQKNSDSKRPDVQEQVLFLRFLELKLNYDRPDRYTSTNEIINNLSNIRKRRYSNHYIRTKIVARLRDEGIVVASSSSGYKLPISEKELYDFATHSSSIIMPMLSRLKKCREQVKIATKNQLDILDNYEDLKEYFDRLDQRRDSND